MACLLKVANKRISNIFNSRKWMIPLIPISLEFINSKIETGKITNHNAYNKKLELIL